MLKKPKRKPLRYNLQYSRAAVCGRKAAKKQHPFIYPVTQCI